ncbi:MAG: hypothetical protein HS117_21180 [Verrucomicrobiaceae bacterium]|nr:hypothetical protein [Verrucomicrobiaceae bacterium]
MKDEFTNRLGAFRTTIDFLFNDANQPKWNGLPPARFTTLAADAASAVNALEAFCQAQGVVITGAAVDKAKEEKELEDAAFVLGQAVAECCRGLGNEADAAKCAFSKSAWQGMRDAALLANAKEVIRIAGLLLAGPNAAAAAECGISAPGVAACQKEADDFAKVISAPQQAIAGKKALTGLLRDRFNAVEAIFTRMDGLVEQFTDKVFVAAYHAARVVRDLGHGPGGGTPPAPVPPPSA